MTDTPSQPAPRLWPSGFSPTGAPVLKVLLILIAVVGFLIPLALVHGVITEREHRYRSVVSEIGGLWGQAQQVAGPILIVPFRRSIPGTDGEFSNTQQLVFFLPDQYTVAADVAPEIRHRGLFEAVVYTADVTIGGTFVLPDAAQWSPAGAMILWDEAMVVVGVSDSRSIGSGVAIAWRDETLRLSPGAPGLSQLTSGGMHAAVPDLTTIARQSIPFELRLRFNGSDSLALLPLGRESQFAVSSSWTDPSFFGAFLPDAHSISEDGFEANWTVSHFGRGYSQQWSGRDVNERLARTVRASELGVRFVQPVSEYLQAERAAKYGVLFIVFTFATLFLFEIVAGVRVHIFQYGLVGLSLCLFYLLLLALAEHLGFGVAYAIGASAVVGQIVLYTRKILASAKRTFGLGLLLAGLYGALYVLMGLEDFVLLLGSVGLFIALGAVMYVTRDIDWYAVGGLSTPPPGAAAAG